MWACLVSALLAAALAAPARAEPATAAVTPKPGALLGRNDASAELAPGGFLFLDVDGCHACHGYFAVTHMLGGHLDVTTVAEEGFLGVLRGDEATHKLARLSGRASPDFASSSFAEVTEPAYIIVRCPGIAEASCAPRWRLQVQRSEICTRAKFVAVARLGGRVSRPRGRTPGPCGKSKPGLLCFMLLAPLGRRRERLVRATADRRDAADGILPGVLPRSRAHSTSGFGVDQGLALTAAASCSHEQSPTAFVCLRSVSQTAPAVLRVAARSAQSGPCAAKFKAETSLCWTPCHSAHAKQTQAAVPVFTSRWHPTSPWMFLRRVAS